MPDVRDLTVVQVRGLLPKSQLQKVRLREEPRPRELKTLSDSCGSRLIILVPPTLGEDHADVLVELGAQMDIPVLVPEKPGTMPRSLFHEGFHLNPTGARLFTAKLESEF